jgi:hypothetical protein
MNTVKATHSQRMCKAVPVATWNLTQIGLSTEGPELQGSF